MGTALCPYMRTGQLPSDLFQWHFLDLGELFPKHALVGSARGGYPGAPLCKSASPVSLFCELQLLWSLKTLMCISSAQEMGWAPAGCPSGPSAWKPSTVCKPGPSQGSPCWFPRVPLGNRCPLLPDILRTDSYHFVSCMVMWLSGGWVCSQGGG